MEKVGLIAGIGRLPVEFAYAARNIGKHVVSIAVLPDSDAELEQAASRYYRINIGQLAQLVKTLRDEGIDKVVVLGKVSKELMFSGIDMDMQMKMLLAALPDKNDDTLMLEFVKVLAQAGITMLDQTSLLKMLMPPVGTLTKREPSGVEMTDIEYGFKIAKQIGGLDIGQTVVVKNQAIMAVEAIEGTDAAIRRGGELGRGGVVVAKVSKPLQDMRFDVPSVGPATIQAMIEAGATALVIEAGKTLVVDRARVVQMANDQGITIIALDKIN